MPLYMYIGRPWVHQLGLCGLDRRYEILEQKQRMRRVGLEILEEFFGARKSCSHCTLYSACNVVVVQLSKTPA
jgi:hypothetical protein